MPHLLHSRVGFEIELLAPRTASRADLAHAIAAATGGDVVVAFHRDSEPSAVPGLASFRHLTRAFDVVDTEGRGVCSVVDDVTIVADLDVRAAPLPGWYRVVTDDPRLLNLLAEVCDPAASLEQVLEPVAALFATTVTRAGGSIFKVSDRDGTSIAMAAPLPGERHRPAEIVTAPLEHDHAAALERLLGPVRELGFRVPVEAAVHLHFDAAPFRTARAFVNVVTLFSAWREPLRSVLGTNSACRRLGPLPRELVDMVAPLRELDSWTDLLGKLTPIELTKYCDVNLLQVVRAPKTTKDTLEVRILPGADAASEIMERTALVEGLLRRCIVDPYLPDPSGNAAEDTATLRRWALAEW